MHNKRCLNCGKLISFNKIYCYKSCEDLHKNLSNQAKVLEFFSYQQAAKYYNKDSRTIKKYENKLFIINKKLNPAIIYKTCKSCNKKSKSAECRQGYCKTCSKNKEGRKNQGEIISKKYKKEGNPNYFNGNSRNTIYSKTKWKQLKKELNYKNCLISNKEYNLDYHHILPAWFCKLVNIDLYDTNNIVSINHEYHKAIHHLKLDILLLPTLYPLYKKDAHLLHKEFLHQMKFRKVHLFDVEKLQQQHLFQIARFPGRKKLLNLLPEFLPPFFDQKGL